MKYLQTPQFHIGLALSSAFGTAFFAVCLWICIGALSTATAQSLKWYACLVGGLLSALILIAGIAGIVLQMIAFSKTLATK